MRHKKLALIGTVTLGLALIIILFSTVNTAKGENTETECPDYFTLGCPGLFEVRLESTGLNANLNPDPDNDFYPVGFYFYEPQVLTYSVTSYEHTVTGYREYVIDQNNSTLIGRINYGDIELHVRGISTGEDSGAYDGDDYGGGHASFHWREYIRLVYRGDGDPPPLPDDLNFRYLLDGYLTTQNGGDANNHNEPFYSIASVHLNLPDVDYDYYVAKQNGGDPKPYDDDLYISKTIDSIERLTSDGQDGWALFSSNLGVHAKANFGEANSHFTYKLISITFPDGSTPESHGWDIVFDSGRDSPNPASLGWNGPKLTASDSAAGDEFGSAVAVDGNTAVIGAGKHNGERGAAYILTHNGTTWEEQQKLTASDGETNDLFGTSAVAIDGNTIVVGATGHNENRGAAYVFTRSGTTWVQQAKLTDSNGELDDSFGKSVAMDGDTIVIGANSDDLEGAAFVFTRNGTTWTQQAKLTSGVDTFGYDFFGSSVAVDGDTAVIGARGIAYTHEIGSVYIFVRNGTTWTQQQKLTTGLINDYFGISVALDGETAVIGALGDNDSGAAYIFTRSGTTWSQQTKLNTNDGVLYDWFGSSVALSDDTVIIGAPREDDNGEDSGSAYIFTRNGITWSLGQKLTDSTSAAGAYFGSGVALSGGVAVIGAYGDGDNGSSRGSAHIFVDPTIEIPQPQATDFKVYLPAVIR